MSASVRPRLVRWWRERCQGLIERIAKLLGHVAVKPQSGDDGALASQRSVGANAGSSSGQAYNVLTAEVTACGNAVNYKLAPFSQVNDNRHISAAYSHNCPLNNQPQPGNLDLASVNAKCAGVEP